jgi:hypothetical protein
MDYIIYIISEHMVFRETVDSDEEVEEEEEEELAPPPPIKTRSSTKKQSQTTSTTSQTAPPSSKSTKTQHRTKTYSKSKELNINDWFGDWWDKRDELTPVMREALVNFRPVQIRNFLKPEMALALHDELYNSPDYQVYESYNRWYQFHFSAIYQHNENYDKNVLLSEISDVMHLQDVRDWVYDISDSEVNGSTLAGAAW